MALLDENGVPVIWPRTPWSFSALKKFEDCGLQYGEVNVKKNYAFETSDAMKAGNVVHKQFEDFITLGTELPMGLRSIGNTINNASKGAVQIYAERDINLSYKLDVCGKWHDDVSYRSRLDVTILRPDAVLIFDFKTSSEPREEMEQLEFAGMAALLEYPEIPVAYGYYLYTKHKPRKMQPLYRADLPNLARSIIPRLERLKTARDTNTYMATPGRHCRWCNVTACPHNPKFVGA